MKRFWSWAALGISARTRVSILRTRASSLSFLDNFSNGHREFVKWGPAEEGDIRDRARLDEVLAKHKPAAILHFAALIEVGESVKDPVAFYENNVIGTLTLLAAAQAAGVKAFVFSSTCATYGLPQSVPLDETHRQVPINPYGPNEIHRRAGACRL